MTKKIKLPPICECCESMVLETSIKFIMSDSAQICSECFREWFDCDSPTNIDPTDSKQLGAWVRKKYSRLKFNPKWTSKALKREVDKLKNILDEKKAVKREEQRIEAAQNQIKHKQQKILDLQKEVRELQIEIF